MRLYFHYCSFGFSNCYVLGEENSLDALIIDPGSMDDQLLDYIENNNFNLKAVLITHDHIGHVCGLRTLMRIYQPEVFAINSQVMDVRTRLIKDGDRIAVGPFTVEVISIPGHSADSVVYHIGSLLFTGDVLTVGLVGNTDSSYGAATQMNKLRSRLLSLPGDYTIFPGHGPPSTLEAERRFNVSINKYNEKKARRPAFKLNL
jgi:glyoxylase-like metal-dependent hydrolase (beta-lactamase superfamily II)